MIRFSSYHPIIENSITTHKQASTRELTLAAIGLPAPTRGAANQKSWECAVTIPMSPKPARAAVVDTALCCLDLPRLDFSKDSRIVENRDIGAVVILAYVKILPFFEVRAESPPWEVWKRPKGDSSENCWYQGRHCEKSPRMIEATNAF